jgi:hypothetical protein
MFNKLWKNILDLLGLSNEERVLYLKHETPIDGHLPDDVKQAMQEVREMRQDKDAPNLFVGKFIKDQSLTCEVIACANDDFRVMPLKIQWERLGTYMDVGKIYPLRVVYESKNGEMKIWEVDPETMKRNTSQVLLAWEKNIGWTWDLDM